MINTPRLVQDALLLLHSIQQKECQIQLNPIVSHCILVKSMSIMGQNKCWLNSIKSNCDIVLSCPWLVVDPIVSWFNPN